MQEIIKAFINFLNYSVNFFKENGVTDFIIGFIPNLLEAIGKIIIAILYFFVGIIRLILDKLL